jgi:hypothetical protein
VEEYVSFKETDGSTSAKNDGWLIRSCMPYVSHNVNEEMRIYD